MKPAENLEALHLANLDNLPKVKVATDSLLVADSPRLSGENAEHSRVLAGAEDVIPPIVVHRPTMRVIDGVHRLRAAKLRGQHEIEVRFFDGDEASSFVLAVRANTIHGLPLSLADRKAAATRILDLYPQWSDRMIAVVTGLSAKAVTAARERSSGAKQQLNARVGRDGRVRPVNGAERREAIAGLLEAAPDASLRQIARRAGVSPGTVRDVRARLDRSSGSGPGGRRSAGRARERPRPGRDSAGRPGGPARTAVNAASALHHLRADPAFRSTESGRSLLRMLAAYQVLEVHHGQLAGNVPVHCMASVAEAAQACARGWQEFADLVERQRQALPDDGL